MSTARRVGRGLQSILLWLALMLLVALSGAWVATRPATPPPFYGLALPGDVAAGTLIKSEPLGHKLPEGARGWRILYSTTRDGRPASASAVVVVRGPAGAPRPVIAWAHGTTGIVAGCAPSVLGRPFDNVPGLDALLAEGWGFVATDYPGLGTPGGHAYLVGRDAAHAVLDAVRAARGIAEAGLGDRVVVWGHSQGGNSALWSGMIAGEVVPSLRIMGIAALAPASDLKGLVAASKGSMFGKIVSSYLIAAYARAYPDVRIADYVGAWSRLVASDIAARCVSGYATMLSIIETLALPRGGIFLRDPTTGPLGDRLAENTPTGRIDAPLLIAQGETDDLVLPAVQRRYVAARCAAGQPVDFRTYPGRDHLSVVAATSPLAADLMVWTRDRLDGKPARSTCASP